VDARLVTVPQPVENTFALAAYNLIRLPKLMAKTAVQWEQSGKRLWETILGPVKSFWVIAGRSLA
jgi:hypothetical protein